MYNNLDASQDRSLIMTQLNVGTDTQSSTPTPTFELPGPPVTFLQPGNKQKSSTPVPTFEFPGPPLTFLQPAKRQKVGNGSAQTSAVTLEVNTQFVSIAASLQTSV